jgi:ClpP class serine protease
MERMSVLSHVVSLMWAMREDAFEEIISFLQGSNDPIKMAQLMHVGSSDQYEKFFSSEMKKPIDYSAMQKVVDQDLPGAYRAEFRNNVAILPVRGPIFPRANLITSWSGGTAVSQLMVDLNAAMSNDSIDTIIQNVDSPGGEITGISEYAQAVMRARESGKKVVSYVYGQGASAAYWVIAPSYKLFLSNTSMVGSIGVVAGYTLSDKADEKRGVQKIEIVSSQSPKKRINPTTEEGRAHIQKTVNALADIFISSVASARGVSTEKVLIDFGEGGMVLADKAVSVGMADGISTLEEVIDSHIRSNSIFMGGSMPISIQQVKSEAPDVYAAIFAEGKTAATTELTSKIASAKEEGIAEGKALGVKSENERIQGIESLSSIPGASAIITKMKFDSKNTKESVSAAILDDQKTRAEALKGNRSKSGEDTARATEETGSLPGQDDDGVNKALQSAMNEGINSIKGISKR